jgi:hypothetical protein
MAHFLRFAQKTRLSAPIPRKTPPAFFCGISASILCAGPTGSLRFAHFNFLQLRQTQPPCPSGRELLIKTAFWHTLVFSCLKKK